MTDLRAPAGLLVTAAVVLTACGGGPEIQTQPTPRDIPAACADTWRDIEASQGSPVQPSPDDQPVPPASPVPLGGQGQVADLAPTLDACDSREEWLEAFHAFPLSQTSGATGIETLRELCRYAERRAVDSPVCEGLLLDEPLDETLDPSPRATETGGGAT